MQEARPNFDEALKIYRDLARENPDVYLPDVASTLDNLGVLSRKQKRKAEARLAFDEALEIYQRLAVRDPDRFGKDVERIKARIGNVPTTH